MPSNKTKSVYRKKKNSTRKQSRKETSYKPKGLPSFVKETGLYDRYSEPLKMNTYKDNHPGLKITQGGKRKLKQKSKRNRTTQRTRRIQRRRRIKRNKK